MRALIPSLLLVTPTLGQNVLVVDDDGGFDHTDLQPAVDAAQSGDVILVRDGAYGSVTIVGKSLTLAADAGAAVTCGSVSVLSVQAGDAVVVAGLDATSDPFVLALSVADCPGHVQLEHCRFAGATAPTRDAARVSNSASVVLIDCEFEGGAGSPSHPPGADPGGVGLGITASSVTAHEVRALGGVGYPAQAVQGSSGGRGVELFDGFLYLSGCDVDGGSGGVGKPSNGFFDPCIDGAPGGTGLFASGTVDVRRRDSAIDGGPGGFGYDCVSGADGTDVFAPAGSVTPMSGPARGFGLTVDPVREGQATSLAFTGLPGELVILQLSPNPECSFQPFFGGTVLVGQPIFYAFLGTLDAGGAKTVGFTIQPAPPAVLATPVYVQGVLWNPSDGFTLTTGELALLLDASF